ncbi:MAG: glutamine amidotransferase [Planctomycetaceae bacterium]|nr:glutamine amidotransferase [Planctomycetaceae bacterium]
MIVANLALGAREWLVPAVALALAAMAVLTWSYLRGQAANWLRTVCSLLKAAGIVLLAVCLVEPLWTGSRPKPGENLFLVLADNSRSLQLADRGSGQTRGAEMQARLAESSPWLTRLAQDFDVRRYAFDTTLRPVRDFTKELTLDGQSSALAGSLTSLAQRFRGQAIAGILVLTDGNETDLADHTADWKSLPPVYPVAIGAESGLADLSVARVSVSHTNFEAAPVTIVAEIAGQGMAGRKVVVRVLDATGKEVERRVLPGVKDGDTLAQRFLVKPERPGVSFFAVETFLEGEEQLLEESKIVGKGAAGSDEATLANNRRLATVDRGGGPYRVLYVSGRPNWEYKFLRRAVEEDDELTLVGLVRIAKKEPKFSFLGRQGERTNPLFRGFNNQTDENAEQYDQPVLLRFGLEEGELDELRGGFPKDAEDLFRYHAVILDDLEAAFFTQDQQSLLAEFVSQRGGALLMLGGNHSLAEGGFQRTPIGEMLPVYLDRSPPVPVVGAYRLKLTREGWLQPWVRVRANEPEEEERLTKMPGFKALNRIDAIKPGASVLAEVESADSTLRPALVVQPYGRGRTATLLVGDLWRWGLRRPDPKESDLEKSWRQTVRWLVSDVPKPVEVETRRAADGALPSVDIVVRARDKQFQPLDNAQVTLKVHTPDKRQIELVADATGAAAGEYRATFTPRDSGAYRASVVVTAPDGSDVGMREAGWAVEPQTEEFRTLAVNRPLLDRIAQESGGEVVSLAGLESFVSSLPNRKIPVTENWTWPLWHQWSVLTLAIGCLVGEWGLRRWRGLP